MVTRSRLAARMRSPVAATRRHEGRSRTPSEAEQAPQREADAPGQVLLEHVRLGGQQHEHRAGQDGGHDHAVARVSGHPMATAPRSRNPDPPEQERGEDGGEQPGQEDERNGQLAVQTGGDSEDRHPEQRGEQAEVGVLTPSVDEGLDAQRSLDQPQVPVEHGPGLEVVVVVLVDGPAGRPGRLRQVPVDPHHGNGAHHRRHHRGPDEPPSGGVGRVPARPVCGGRCHRTARSRAPGVIPRVVVGARRDGLPRTNNGHRGASLAVLPHGPHDRGV